MHCGRNNRISSTKQTNKQTNKSIQHKAYIQHTAYNMDAEQKADDSGGSDMMEYMLYLRSMADYAVHKYIHSCSEHWYYEARRLRDQCCEAATHFGLDKDQPLLCFGRTDNRSGIMNRIYGVICDGKADPGVIEILAKELQRKDADCQLLFKDDDKDLEDETIDTERQEHSLFGEELAHTLRLAVFQEQLCFAMDCLKRLVARAARRAPDSTSPREAGRLHKQLCSAYYVIEDCFPGLFENTRRKLVEEAESTLAEAKLELEKATQQVKVATQQEVKATAELQTTEATTSVNDTREMGGESESDASFVSENSPDAQRKKWLAGMEALRAQQNVLDAKKKLLEAQGRVLDATEEETKATHLLEEAKKKVCSDSLVKAGVCGLLPKRNYEDLLANKNADENDIITAAHELLGFYKSVKDNHPKYSFGEMRKCLVKLLQNWEDQMLTKPTLVQQGYGSKEASTHEGRVLDIPTIENSEVFGNGKKSDGDASGKEEEASMQDSECELGANGNREGGGDGMEGSKDKGSGSSRSKLGDNGASSATKMTTNKIIWVDSDTDTDLRAQQKYDDYLSSDETSAGEYKKGWQDTFIKEQQSRKRQRTEKRTP